MHENSSSKGVEKCKNFLGENSPRPRTITWESTKHGLSVHGPLCLDRVHGLSLWTRSARDFSMALSPFSTRRIFSRDAKRKTNLGNVIAKKFAAKKLDQFLLFYCSREQIRQVENGLYASMNEC